MYEFEDTSKFTGRCYHLIPMVLCVALDFDNLFNGCTKILKIARITNQFFPIRYNFKR